MGWEGEGGERQRRRGKMVIFKERREGESGMRLEKVEKDEEKGVKWQFLVHLMWLTCMQLVRHVDGDVVDLC